MSKVVFICLKDPGKNPYSRKDADILSDLIAPDNISPNPPKIIQDNGILVTVFNPAEALLVKNTSICLGHIIDSQDSWHKPLSKVPDGAFAIFRSNKNTVELISDMTASRSIWYTHTQNMLIASNSQRAIIMLLKSFKPNRVVFSWMLSSGTIGPGNSWDSRIKHLPPNARLILDRMNWNLTLKQQTHDFTPSNISDEEHERRFTNILERIFTNLEFDPSKYALALSGGFDSRTILLMLLKMKKNIKCITWGLKSSLEDEHNDPYVARSITKLFGLNHIYLETDISKEPAEKILVRFLVAGEGRNDDVGAYIDGLNTWKSLFESKVSAVLRGDQCCGDPVSNVSSFRPRQKSRVELLSDYGFCKDTGEIKFEKQNSPPGVERKPNESLITWYIRLYQEFHVPFILAPLNELKSSYVEMITPLLSNSIVKYTRQMPDHLLINKTLFKKIAHSINPGIEFTSSARAIIQKQDLLKIKDIKTVISDELNDSYSRTILPGEFIEYVFSNINKFILDDTVAVKSLTGGSAIDCSRLALRTYIICKMTKILSEDAKALTRR
ncbi:MAG: hypothetical protein JW946_04465 [Candidatus Omnitrophica bacterium]|nr:hypothetical protein [Candidatus Omnitrophota bacterium]